MEKTKDKEVYMKEYKEFTVRYLLDEDEQDAVKKLNQKFREYISPEGTRPFAEQTDEQLFDYIMNYGCKNDISGKIGFAMVQMGMININEWLSRNRNPVDVVKSRDSDDRSPVSVGRKRRLQRYEPCER